MSAPESTSSESKAIQSFSPSLPKPSLATRVRSAWATDVDPASSSATWMLIYLCFLTGYTSSVTFSACFIWFVCSCSLWFDCEEGASRGPVLNDDKSKETDFIDRFRLSGKAGEHRRGGSVLNVERSNSLTLLTVSGAGSRRAA